jgi:hypothetical protein
MWSISNESKGGCSLNVSSVESAPSNWNVALVVENVQEKKEDLHQVQQTKDEDGASWGTQR